MPKLNESKLRERYLHIKELVESEGYILYDLRQEAEGTRGRKVWEVTVSCGKGHEPYSTKWSNFKNNGTRCRKCMAKRFSEERTKSYDEVRQYIESFGYKMISKEYTGKNNKFEVECPRGHTYLTSWAIFGNNGSRCPRCKSSRGENIIRFILEQYEVSFKEQYRVKYRGRNHFFDFYLPDYNLFIEYQGEQHFTDSNASRWLGEEKIKTQTEFDQLKRNYCSESKISLLEIPYIATPADVHKNIIHLLRVSVKEVDMSLAEFHIKNLNVKEMLRYYRWHTIKETSEKFSISETQIWRYTKGTGTKIKPVKQIKDGNTIMIYDTQKEVEEKLGFQINSCLKGKTKTAGGYNWQYVTQEEYEAWRGYNG